jgi:hypothetical protein
MRPNLDLLAQGSFQTTPDGVRLFYPNGFASKGYIVDTEARYQYLFRQQKRWGLIIMLSITLLAALHAGWQVILPVFIALNLAKQSQVRRTTRQMQPSDKVFLDVHPSSPYNLPSLTRGGAVWQLVGLITRRSQVQILPPQPNTRAYPSNLVSPLVLLKYFLHDPVRTQVIWHCFSRGGHKPATGEIKKAFIARRGIKDIFNAGVAMH